MARRSRGRAITLLTSLTLLALALGCADRREWVRATVIDNENDLIGGPSAKGKLGDMLIENDQIRAIIASNGPTFSAGVFGGTLIDLDRTRWRSDQRGGRGWDAFSEAFPLANLLVPNPSDPPWVLSMADGAFQIQREVTAIEIVKDGSDGQEAIIRVKGHSAYMFDVLKFLNRDFLEAFLADGIAGLSLKQIINLAKSVLGVDLLGLLNRLQINFDISTEYVLHPGESYLTMRTTLILSPPSEKALADCPAITCDLDCPYGYMLDEVKLDLALLDGAKGPKLCPVCACAEARDEMPTFNESRDFFQVLLGTPDSWADPSWKGGVVTGDFLFYGGECAIFTPGLGFDYDKKIYGNLWQGVGTMGSPWAMPFVSGVAKNISYSWTAANPRVREGFDCPSYRLAITRIEDEREDEIAPILTDDLGFQAQVAANAARIAVVDRNPIFLDHAILADASADPGADATPAERAQAFAAWKQDTLDSAEVRAFASTLGAGVTLDLIPQHDCMQSRMLVPLFTTSATAVLSHFSEGDRLVETEDGAWRDSTRAYTFERYLVVGDGDIASTLDDVYALRKTPHGHVRGVVVEEGSGRPISHADVFVLADPRADPDAPVPANMAEYRALAQDAYAMDGVVSYFQTDVGDDPVRDGDFRGPFETGRWFLVAHTLERGTSRLVPIAIEADKDVVVHLTLPPPGSVEYQVTDDTGGLMPARLTFFALDEQGRRQAWGARAETSLGDPQLDHGIVKLEHSASGHGSVELPAGRYDVVVSRGFEYSADVLSGITVSAGKATEIEAVLERQVDTSGFISGDFHIHQSPSSDAGLDIHTRLKAIVAEGVEFASSSDHDHLLDYDPYLRDLGLLPYLKTQIGAEVSPLEFGHLNGFPLHFDERSNAMNDPPPWPGRTLEQTFEEMRDRADDPDEFVLELNHPRDGTLGTFSQIGLKGYDLERVTPGMQMCNQVLETVPCTFDAMEILNGKHVEYLWTPTIGEMRMHNLCYGEIIDARDRADFALNGLDAERSVCGWLQVDPLSDCDARLAQTEGLMGEAGVVDASAGGADALRMRDRCSWHRGFRAEMARCGEAGVDILTCKRIALEALKALSVRYMVERTPLEQAAYAMTTAETDLGCDFVKAFTGCEALSDDEGGYQVGCGGEEDCFCQACVCGVHPECCQSEADGGTGWTSECADACAAECGGCGQQPCTDRFQMLDDWFAFLNVGFEIAGVANSDSHGTLNEVGMPRTYIPSNSDRPDAVNTSLINKNLKAGRSTLSAGPFVEARLIHAGGSADIGDTLDASGGQPLQLWVRVQTADWFGVDRVEVYRNGHQEHIFFLDPTAADDAHRETIVDFERTIDLTRPNEDSWYVVMAYGARAGDQMSPVYKRRPYGHILFTTVIALAADSLLASFGGLLDKLPAGLLDVNSLLGSLELPDSFPVIPWGGTNPIFVDVDGGGYWPVAAQDADADGQPDLPPFCSVACEPQALDEGGFGPGTCGRGQTCVPDERYPEGGVCKIPVPEHCVGLQPVGGVTDTLSGALGAASMSKAPFRPFGGLMGRLFDPHRR